MKDFKISVNFHFADIENGLKQSAPDKTTSYGRFYIQVQLTEEFGVLSGLQHDQPSVGTIIFNI